MERTTSMSFKIINVTHRHCVFTIADELRPFFLKDRSLLNCLLSAVPNVLLRMFHKDNKSELFTPGFICVLHTFGRDYRNHKNGFYVYAKPNKCNPSSVIKYIGRYLGRPVIATSRIDKYDGEKVTFHYNRHEDDKLITETIPVLDFIARLIRHIPEKHMTLYNAPAVAPLCSFKNYTLTITMLLWMNYMKGQLQKQSDVVRLFQHNSFTVPPSVVNLLTKGGQYI